MPGDTPMNGWHPGMPHRQAVCARGCAGFRTAGPRCFTKAAAERGAGGAGARWRKVPGLSRCYFRCNGPAARRGPFSGRPPQPGLCPLGAVPQRAHGRRAGNRGLRMPRNSGHGARNGACPARGCVAAEGREQVQIGQCPGSMPLVPITGLSQTRPGHATVSFPSCLAAPRRMPDHGVPDAVAVGRPRSRSRGAVRRNGAMAGGRRAARISAAGGSGAAPCPPCPVAVADCSVRRPGLRHAATETKGPTG